MPTVLLHSSDAEAFILKFGQPMATTAAGKRVHLRYAELPEEAKKVALKLEEMRLAQGDPPHKLLRYDGEKLNIEGEVPVEEEEKPKRAYTKKATKKVAKRKKTTSYR